MVHSQKAPTGEIIDYLMNLDPIIRYVFSVVGREMQMKMVSSGPKLPGDKCMYLCQMGEGHQSHP